MGVPLEAKQQFIQCCLSEQSSAGNIIAMDFGNKEGILKNDYQKGQNIYAEYYSQCLC